MLRKDFDWSMQINFHQFSNRISWLKQWNKSSASFFLKAIIEKAYEVLNSLLKNYNVYLINVLCYFQRETWVAVPQD